MEKSQIKILIVEDDGTLGRSLLAALKDSGFSAVHTQKPEEALAMSKMQVFGGFVIDCLLPKMSGVDLAKQLRDQVGADVPIVLMSGIYKDKNFMKEAITKTGAKLFLEKPFGVEEIVKIFEENLSGLIDEPMDPMTELFFKTSTTPGERLKAIESVKSINGFELPRVLSCLVGPGIQGVLSLKDTTDGTESSIHFREGRITKVNVKDPQSFFGALLVEKHYLTAEELELALAAPGQKKIGERLVEQNLLSPHVIALVNAEQMAIRLSLLVKDTSYDIAWKNEVLPASEFAIEPHLLNSFLSDWVTSKLPSTWLKAFYMPFLTNKISKTSLYALSHPIFQLQIMADLPDFTKKIDSGTNLQTLLSAYGTKEENVLEAIHMLVLTHLLAFDKSIKTADVAVQTQRFQKIFSEIQGKNNFEILGVSTKAKSSDIKKAYHELAKVFHPDKLTPGTPTELVDVTRGIFSKMTVAYEILSDDKKRSDYMKELEQGRAEKILQSEALFEEGKTNLKAGQIQKALDKFQEAVSLRPPPSELMLYLLWARLMNLSATQDQQKVLTEVEVGLNKVPPEDRHNATYYFVKGLFQKFIGDLDLAKRNLEHALSLSPAFVEAKRELNLLKSSADNKPVDIFRDDLSKVVTSFFKKKR